MENLAVDTNGYLSTLTYAMIGVTAASALAFAVTLGITIQTSRALKTAVSAMKTCSARVAQCQGSMDSLLKMVNKSILQGDKPGLTNYYISNMMEVNDKLIAAENASERASAFAGRIQAKSSLCKKLSTGIGVALVILVAITTYLSWKDLKDSYKVEYTPIPRYMVDEKDITSYNEKGEKIVIKNQAAYYTAVRCNRNSGDEFYDTLRDIADLNGDVGKQWLALYCAKNNAERPILADSLKVVTGDSQIPADYTEGIHMFGVGAAENINNTLYVWNSGAKSIFAYYKKASERDVSKAGPVFTAGSLALSGGAGILLGSAASGLLFHVSQKKRRKREEMA